MVPSLYPSTRAAIKDALSFQASLSARFLVCRRDRLACLFHPRPACLPGCWGVGAGGRGGAPTAHVLLLAWVGTGGYGWCA